MKIFALTSYIFVFRLCLTILDWIFKILVSICLNCDVQLVLGVIRVSVTRRVYRLTFFRVFLQVFLNLTPKVVVIEPRLTLRRLKLKLCFLLGWSYLPENLLSLNSRSESHISRSIAGHKLSPYYEFHSQNFH